MNFPAVIALALVFLTSGFSMAAEKKAPAQKTVQLLALKEVYPDNCKVAKEVDQGNQPCPTGYQLHQFPILDGDGKNTGENRPMILSQRNIITESSVQRAIAVCDKGQALSAPVVQSTLNRDFQISGIESKKERDRIVKALNAASKK